MKLAFRGAPRRLLAPLAVLALGVACSGGSDDGCPTCPPPPSETGALRLEIEFDDAAKGGLQPAGFSVSDLERIDLVVAGTGESITRTLKPSENRAFFELELGRYVVTATAMGPNDLELFGAVLDVTIAVGDTVDATLEMEPALGTVTFEVGGQTSGTVEAVAGEGVPFSVTVRNSQGRPVPGSSVRITRSDPDYGQVLFDGTNETDLQGRVTGLVNAAFSGSLDLSVEVDRRPIPAPGPTRVEFVTGVSAAKSSITDVARSGTMLPPTGGNLVADGQARFEYTVEVRNKNGDPLPGVPVTPTSNRNAGVDPDVDIIEPANGYESGKTDANGVFRFRVRTFSSSFLFLNGDDRLESTNGTFVPNVVEVVADGVGIDQRSQTWNSTVHPNLGGLNTSKRFVTANGQDFAVIMVDAEKLSQAGGGPVAHAYVEIVTARGDVLNHVLDITPEPGFDGFRTNAQGEWRGRISSTTTGDVFFGVKVDGRALILDTSLRAVSFR